MRVSCDEIVERQHAVDQEHLVVGDGERALHEIAQFGRHRRVHLEPDHRAAAALLQRRLEQAHQIFRLFLDFHFRVADDAEGALPLHRVAGEQPADEQAGRALQRDDAHLVAAARQADEAVDLLRHADERVHRLAVLHARELQRQREAEIGNERERMRRVDGERRQQRKDVGEEVVLEPGALGLLEVVGVDQRHALVGQVGAQRQPALLLVAGEDRHRLADARELLDRRQPFRALRGDALPHLALEAGDAHHEEFVEVVGRDRQEADALEQRMVLVGRLLQHPPVEVQPGQFAVDEARRALPQRRLDSCRRSRGGRRLGDVFVNNCSGLPARRHGRSPSLKHRGYPGFMASG